GLPAFRAARAVVAYAPIENEVDPGALVAAAAATGKPVYYPRRTSDGLEFLQSGPEGLAPRWSALPEPLDGAPLSPAAGEGVVFLVPGIAFDPRGVRLGRGAGCYARSLARASHAALIVPPDVVQVAP